MQRKEVCIINQLINFIKEYKDLILSLLSFICLIFSIIFYEIKNKKLNSSNIFNDLLQVLPNFIKTSEKISSSSDDKLSFCLNLAVNFLSSKTGLSSNAILEKYGDFIINSIEEILSTPQKKEVITK